MLRNRGYKTIDLYGRSAEKIDAEVLDLQHGLQFVPMATVVGSDDVEVCRDADVLVMTIGGVPKPGQTPLDLAEASVAICRNVLPPLLTVAPRAVVVVVTNPVDVVTYATLKILGPAPESGARLGHIAGQLPAAFTDSCALRGRSAKRARVHRGRTRRFRNPAVEQRHRRRGADPRVGRREAAANECART